MKIHNALAFFIDFRLKFHNTYKEVALLSGHSKIITFLSFIFSEFSGTDTDSCGRTKDSDCESLEFILNHYYKNSSSPDEVLEIITSKSIVIDKRLAVSVS